MERDTTIVALCGKRSTGKDTLAVILTDLLMESGKRIGIESLARHFKKIFAERNHLDFQRLIEDRAYKEQHRKQMNSAFALFHAAEPELCCQEAIRSASAKQVDILIITDVRLKNDLRWLQAACPRVISVHLTASDQVKASFGWIYDAEVDRHWTEVDLDDQPASSFSIHFDNAGTMAQLICDAKEIVKTVLN